MSETNNEAEGGWWGMPLLRHIAPLQERENQVFLLLTLAIGALTGLAVVAFIVLTERLGMRLYPVAARHGDGC
jgi:chloride channel protein, CIC family